MNKEILFGKNCFITGAKGGLGKEIAFEMAKCGCNLFLTGRNTSNLEMLKSELKKINKNIKIFFEKCDLNNFDEIKRIISKAKN